MQPNIALEPSALITPCAPRLSANVRQHEKQQTDMAIPELERARVERALAKFCDRVPGGDSVEAHVRVPLPW